MLAQTLLHVLLTNINVLTILLLVRVLVAEVVVVVVVFHLLVIFRFVPSPTGNMVCQI